jgi:hypothetical protein
MPLRNLKVIGKKKAWSAYADGYIKEGDTYLESRFAQLKETLKLLAN